MAEERRSKKAKLEKDDEKRAQKFLQQQLERLKEKEVDCGLSKEVSADSKVLKREKEDEKVTLSFSATASAKESNLT